ncbi:MAG: mechanosensitive ion channel family protein [Bacteroidales bacterium]|nr:mechanosensitive ion channel family protein [Bacteroidales bacterium]
MAIVFLLIGLKIISILVKFAGKGMEKRGTDETLRPFLLNLLSWILKAALVITVIQMLGVATTSFVALLGVAGLAVGFALQGTLANFAGGALILLFKPYKVGDLIESQGHLGVVKEIQIFTTILLNPQNRTIILPNGAVSNGDITNYTREGKLRVDLTVGIAYESDIRKAKQVLLDAAEVTIPFPQVDVHMDK